MDRSFFNQLVSTPVHIHDLFDTVVYGFIKSLKKRSENRAVNNARDRGKLYYNTCKNIKNGKGQS